MHCVSLSHTVGWLSFLSFHLIHTLDAHSLALCVSSWILYPIAWIIRFFHLCVNKHNIYKIDNTNVSSMCVCARWKLMCRQNHEIEWGRERQRGEMCEEYTIWLKCHTIEKESCLISCTYIFFISLDFFSLVAQCVKHHRSHGRPFPMSHIAVCTMPNAHEGFKMKFA